MNFFENIFVSNFDSSKVCIDNISLDKTYNLIDKSLLKQIYLIDYKNEIEESNTTLFDKFEDFDGWVLLSNDIQFGIKNKKVIWIRLNEDSLLEIKSMTYIEIEEVFGQPEIVLLDDICYGSIWDYSIESYLLVYENKKITFFIDCYNKNLKTINIGFLDYSFYRKRDRAEYTRSITRNDEKTILEHL